MCLKTRIYGNVTCDVTTPTRLKTLTEFQSMAELWMAELDCKLKFCTSNNEGTRVKSGKAYSWCQV